MSHHNLRFFLNSWYVLSLLQDSSFEDRYDGYLTLAEYVQDFLNHLTEQPGCFETEIEQFAETLNGWVTADEALQELVELIYQQVACVFFLIAWMLCCCYLLSKMRTGVLLVKKLDLCNIVMV